MEEDDWKSRLSSLEGKMVTRAEFDAANSDIKEIKEMMIRFFASNVSAGVHQGSQAAGRALAGPLKLNAQLPRSI
jgi:hypothetical protein